MRLWSDRQHGTAPVDKAPLPPTRAHSANPLPQRNRGVIPGLHTLYDYDKGIS
jgi:hypothetical protein